MGWPVPGGPAVRPHHLDPLNVPLGRFALLLIVLGVELPSPFDSCSPFWVAGSAIQLARAVGVPVDAALAVIAPAAEPPYVLDHLSKNSDS